MILLHIGFPKTATTALQKVFSSNIPTLLECGIEYPLIDGDFKQRCLKALLSRKSAPDRRMSSSERRKLEELAFRIKGSPAKIILLSCEELTNELDFDLSAAELKNLVEYLSQFGRPVTVVAYARNPVEYYLSRMQERLKYRGGIIRPEVYKSSFSWVLDQYSDAFSREVIARPFERSQLTSGSIVADFFEIVRRNIDIDIPFLVDGPVNESLSSEVMFCLDLLYSSLGEGQESGALFRGASASLTLWRRLQRVDSKFGERSPKPKIYSDVGNALEHRLKKDFIDLEERYGIKFAPAKFSSISRAHNSGKNLTSVEEIIPVDQQRGFYILARVLAQAVRER